MTRALRALWPALRPALWPALWRARWPALPLLLAGAACGGREPDPPDDVRAEFDAWPSVEAPCPAPGPDAAREAAAEARAAIPLVEGLTLSTGWVRSDLAGDDFERECLEQVTAAGPAGVVVTTTCPQDREGRRYSTGTRDVCRADLRGARAFYTATGRRRPPRAVGTTAHGLSLRAFRELRDGGGTWHRYVDLLRGSEEPGASLAKQGSFGWLRRTGTGAFPIVVNGETVALPVLHAEATMRTTWASRGEPLRLTVLDDERFPFVLDYEWPRSGFRIRYGRITYPRRDALERGLAEERRTELAGLYFAHNSAELRRESEPVLREVVAVLARHPDWRLRVEGHTDSVGGDAFNRDLSMRRARAVRDALTTRYRVAPDRLGAVGRGASVPRHRNDTAEGRARNRRVELARE